MEPSGTVLQELKAEQENVASAEAETPSQEPCTASFCNDRSLAFPLCLNKQLIFALSVSNCVIAAISFVLGAIIMLVIPHFTSQTAVPIWCGLLLIASGVVGTTLRRNQSKCLIAAFLGLSIVSIALVVAQYIMYSLALKFVKNTDDKSISTNHHRNWCIILIMFYLVLLLLSLACSVGSLLLSVAAYWKFCSSCDVKYCLTCVGCCEWETTSKRDERSNDESNHDQSRDQWAQGLGIKIVNQSPLERRRTEFPFIINYKLIFRFSSVKCAVGPLFFMIGVANISFIQHYTSKLAFPIWSGLVIMINGIVGVVLRQSANKCMIGAFLALSLTSLVLTISMLAMHTIALAQYILSYYGDSPSKSLELALTIALMCLVAVDFVCSVSAVALACEAYCKFCSTCDVRDCMVCQGCCECDGATYSEELSACSGRKHRFKNSIEPVATYSGNKPNQSSVNSGEHCEQHQDDEVTYPPALVNIFVTSTGVLSSSSPMMNNELKTLHEKSCEQEFPDISVNIRPANSKEIDTD